MRDGIEWWTRSRVIALADVGCSSCHGCGLVGRLGDQPCDCVLRAIYRGCLRRYREIGAAQLGGRTRSSLAFVDAGGRSPLAYARSSEDFRAEFYLSSKRVLSGDDWKLFTLSALEELDWRTCCELLRLEKVDFFNRLYRMQARVGRAMGEIGSPARVGEARRGVVAPLIREAA